MTYALIAIHLTACAVLVLVVLLQSGKGAALGAAFGGASQTVFGSTGAQTFLGKLTTAVAIIFMLTSLTLAVTSGNKTNGGGLMSTDQPAAQSTAVADQATATAQATAAADQGEPTPAPTPTATGEQGEPTPAPTPTAAATEAAKPKATAAPAQATATPKPVATQGAAQAGGKKK